MIIFWKEDCRQFINQLNFIYSYSFFQLKILLLMFNSNLGKMSCSGNNETIKCCADQRCNQPPLMCSFIKCKCYESHKLCKGTHEYQPIVNQLIQKTSMFKRPYENIIICYNNIEKQINSDRHQLLRKIDAITEKFFEPSQIKLLEAIHEGKSWKITGETMSKIVMSLKKLPFDFNVVQDKIRSEISKLNKDVQDHLFCMKNIWDAQKDDKQNFEKVKKCGIRWTWLNGKWIKPVPQQFNLCDLTGLGLDFIDPPTIRILSMSCPKLQGLQVGYWVANSNFDDACAQAIAEHLPYLKRFWIYNSPLSDRGAVSVSNNFKCLQYLILNNCRLSANGKAQIRRILSQCKKIQLL